MLSMKSVLFIIIINVNFNSLYSSNQIQRSIPSKRVNHTNLHSLRDHYKNCDHVIKNRKISFIISPFFPNNFPLPIYCRWIIDVSSFNSRNDNQTLIVYLNELYVKRGLKFTEYSYFLDENLNIDRNELPIVNFNSNYNYIATRRKYLVIKFQIDEKVNHNLNARIVDSPFHQNGFNLTFELTNRNILTQNQNHFINVGDNKEICSFKKCNFNGRCIARSQNNLFRFRCECFDGYHGENCEFGPQCDPFRTNNNINPCINGANCVYSNEAVRIKCKCSEDFTGPNCEKPQFNSQYNVTNNSNYIVKVKLQESTNEQTNENRNNIRSKLKQMIISLVRQYDRNIYLQDIKLHQNNILEIHLFYQNNNEEFIRTIFNNQISKGSLGKFVFDKNYIIVITESAAFTIIDLNIENDEIDKNGETTINCFVKGLTSNGKVRWWKDGELIDLNTGLKTFRHKITYLANAIKSTLILQNSIELDSSSFTCSASDKDYELTKSIYLQLTKNPETILEPLSLTVNYMDKVTINCYANTKHFNTSNLNFSYNWLNGSNFINQFNRLEMIQDLYPTGSRLTVLNISRSTEYKCCTYTLLGSTCREIFVDVVKASTESTQSNYYSKESLCKPEIKDEIEWKQTFIDFYYIEKCPQDYVGEVRRKCLYLGENEIPTWSEIDYSNCTFKEFESLFQKFRNYFLGYGNRSYENLIEQLATKLKVHKFKNGEGEVILNFIDQNFSKLIKNRVHFNADEYQRIMIKYLTILNTLLDSFGNIYNLAGKNRFQFLAFNISDQVDLDNNAQVKWEKNLKILNFTNFKFTFLPNKKQSNTFALTLKNTNSDFSALITLSNSSDSKWIFLVYKVNHFLSKRDLASFESLNEYSNDHPNNLNYFAIKNFANKISGADSKNSQIEIKLPIESNEKVIRCAGFEYQNKQFKLISYHEHECYLKFHRLQDSMTVVYNSMIKTNYAKSTRREEATILKGKNKIAINVITIISCSLFMIAMILNLISWRRNGCLAGVLLYRCITLIINHVSTAMVLQSADQRNENYWLMLFTLSQISALTIQFCVCVAIEHNFDQLKSQYAKNISLRITIVSTIVPFSLIGLIYEFYYTSINRNFLWTLQVGSTLFYSIILTSIIATLANLSFYIKLNNKLQPLRRKDTLILDHSNRYENTSKILAQNLIITIILNIHLGFIMLIINLPSSVHNSLVAGYSICSLMITLLVLISFKSKISKFKPSKRSYPTENLSLNKQRKAFKHYDSSNTNSRSLFNNNEIQSIFN